MKYKYFLFDWDGTIADSLPVWVPALKEAFADFGIEVSEQEVGEKVVANWRGPEELGITDREAFFAKAAARLEGRLPKVSMVQGARELLEDVKARGGKVGILTSSMREWVLPAIDNLGIGNLIDVFLGKEDVVENKPNPEMIEKAMMKLGAEREFTVMVGDHQKDIEMAENAGVDSVLYYPASYERYYRREFQASLGATYVIGNFKDLVDSGLTKNPPI